MTNVSRSYLPASLAGSACRPRQCRSSGRTCRRAAGRRWCTSYCSSWVGTARALGTPQLQSNRRAARRATPRSAPRCQTTTPPRSDRLLHAQNVNELFGSMDCKTRTSIQRHIHKYTHIHTHTTLKMCLPGSRYL